MKAVDPIFQTVFSELEQRCLDAEFDETFPETGRFKKTTVKGHDYWYFHQKIDGTERKRYVGPAHDPEIAKRVEEFARIKDDYRGRRRMVSTLVNDAHLPRPVNGLTGDVVEAFWKAGLFRLRAVIVGSVAFSCYPGLLGLRFPTATMATTDIDVAQFHSISISVDDSIPPVLDVLRGVDPSFHEIPHQSDGRLSSQFINDTRFRVDFLAPNNSKDEYLAKPAQMPALGGAAATTLRFLDFLIANPVRSVMLHKGGIPVRIPAPERYAVHKLIVASRRHDTQDGGMSKRDKGAAQAGILLEALAQKRRHADVADVWSESWERGPAWREALSEGRSMLAPSAQDALTKCVIDGSKALGITPDGI